MKEGYVEEAQRIRRPTGGIVGGCILLLRRCLMLGLLIGCPVLVVLYLISLAGRPIFLAELALTFRFHLGCLILAATAVLMLTKRFRFGLLYLLLAVTYLGSVVWISLPTKQPAAGESKISLMAFNLYNDNAQPRADFEMLLDQDPDILLLTEFTDSWHKRLKPLVWRYPYSIQHPRWHGYGIALYSKYPIVGEQLISLSDSFDIPMLAAGIKLEHQTLRILGAHTVSPVTSVRIQVRNEQLALIAQQVSADSQPTVLLGDLNCVPWSSAMYPIFETGLRDTRQGFGFLPTWHRQIQLLQVPIDHAFVSREIHVHRRAVVRSYGSDHFPIWLEISLAPSGR